MMVRKGRQQLIKSLPLSDVFTFVTYCGRPSLGIVQIFEAFYDSSSTVRGIGAINLVNQIFVGAKSVYQKHPWVDHLSIMNHDTSDDNLRPYSFVPLFGMSKIL